jgi:thiamine transport system permease protein
MAKCIEQVRNHQFSLKLFAAFGFILSAMILGIGPLLWLGLAQGFGGFDAYLVKVVTFTLWQSFLSTTLSLAIAIPVAIALARRDFLGRRALLGVFSIPLALPAIVAILGIVGVYGNEGWLGGWFSIYGISGIVFAHVFFNMPLAVRLLLTRLEAIPPESYRLGGQLGFTDGQFFRFIAWPQISSPLIGIASLIFLLCMASFTVVLILGGGPQATTLEVAIYQSLRLDFDPGLAAILALTQMIVCGFLVFIAGQFAREVNVFPHSIAQGKRFDGASISSRIGDVVSIIIAISIVLPPMVAVILSGVASVQFTASLRNAVFTSLGIGFASAALSLTLGWILAHSAAKSNSVFFRSAIGVASLAAFILPPAVLATGWFLLLAPLTDVSQLAVYLVITLNAMMALPFVWSPLYPAITESLQRHDRLCESVGLRGIARLWLVELPVLRRPLALAFMMAVIVSLGDLSAIVFFGNPNLVTLPALIMQQMGHYKMQDAAGSAFILTALCFALLTLAQKWGDRHDQS